ncbi:MAG: hypothetical protein MUO76_16630, partial [Anaerolineaceae bacterium]|nr:hypothetical protein [Anaerolineaceae bacterium]
NGTLQAFLQRTTTDTEILVIDFKWFSRYIFIIIPVRLLCIVGFRSGLFRHKIIEKSLYPTYNLSEIIGERTTKDIYFMGFVGSDQRPDHGAVYKGKSRMVHALSELESDALTGERAPPTG